MTDCTEFTVRLSVVNDLTDHSVITWDTEGIETHDLVTWTFDKALEISDGIKTTLLNSNQGVNTLMIIWLIMGLSMVCLDRE